MPKKKVLVTLDSKEKLPPGRIVPPEPKSKIEVLEEVTVDDDGNVIEEQTESEREDQSKLDILRSMFGNRQYRLIIQKKNPDTHEWEWVDRVTFDGFDPMSVKKYGGGEYRCLLNDERGKFVKDSSMYFTFAKSIMPEEPKKEKSPMEDPTVLFVMESMKNQSAMLMEILRTSLTGQATQPKNDLAGLVTALKGLNDLSPKDDSFKQMKDMMTLFNQMNEMRGDREESSPGIMSELKEAFKMVMSSRSAPNPVAPPRSQGARTIVVKPPEQPLTEKEANASKESLIMSPAIEAILFYVPKFKKFGEEYISLTGNGQHTESEENIDRASLFLTDILDSEVVPLAYQEFKMFLKTKDDAWDFLIDWAKEPDKVEKIFQYAPDLVPLRDWVILVVNRAVQDFESEEIEAAPAATTVNGRT